MGTDNVGTGNRTIYWVKEMKKPYEYYRSTETHNKLFVDGICRLSIIQRDGCSRIEQILLDNESLGSLEHILKWDLHWGIETIKQMIEVFIREGALVL